MAHLEKQHRFVGAALLTVLLPKVAVGSASSAASSQADSTPATATAGPQGVTVEPLSRGTVAKPFEVEASGIELEAERKIDVAAAHLTFEPRGTTGWHTHPGPTVVTVTVGELTLVRRDCTRQTYEAGQTFIEQGPETHLARNTGGAITETLVTFFAPTEAELFAPAPPPPGGCRSQ